jgi:hypothetical protein
MLMKKLKRSTGNIFHGQKGLKILQDRDQTIKYVLQLKGLLEEEEKYQLPPDFLMEMMEMNEKLLEEDPDDFRKEVKE